jgi:DNA-binding CsgD family transcriptional regulator/tetratricopeptide (TPR) repeat protein
MGTPQSAPGLRGRQTESTALDGALDRVASGRAAIVLVDGEAGIGKTRLLEDALARARGRGMRVEAGRAGELERTRPFGLMADVFGCARSSPDPRRAAIGELLAAGDASGRSPITVTSDPGLQFRTVDAFADLAEELALAGPLVIGADDLHWADPSSLLTLGALAARLRYLPAAIIGCFRPAPRAAELERLAGALEAAGGRRLSLRELDQRAVSELVAETVGAAPGRRLLAGIAGAAGNPLFVTELLGALAQEQMIEIAAGQAEVSDLALPPTLRLTILRRISFLPEEALQALRAAVILGSGFTLTDLATVTGQPALRLSEVLAEPIRARVLTDDGTRLRFRHDLIRDAIYDDLPGSIRNALHREAGQRLAAAGAPARQVAEHLARGAGAGDAEAASWLARAARQAAATSPDVAAGLLDRAIGLTPAAGPGRDRLLAERADALMLAGRVPSALTACRDLLGRPHDPDVDGQVQVCLAHALLAQGQVRDARDELERACQAPGLPPAARTAALAWAGFARISLGDLDGAAASVAAASVAAGRDGGTAAGDHLVTSITLSTMARVAESRGRLREALGLADEAVRLADVSPGRLGHRFPVCVTRGRLLIELDRLPEARSVLSDGLRICEELGVRWAAATHQVYLAYGRFTAGEWDDAAAELEASLGIAEEIGEIYSMVYAYGLMARISFYRDELGPAREAAAAAGRYLAGWGSGHSLAWVAWPRALLLEADGEHAQALAAMAGLWEWCAGAGLVLEYPAIGADLVRLALAAGEQDRARAVAAAVTAVAADNDVAWMTGEALRCQGLASDDPEVLAAAAAAHARGARPYQLAQASEDAGRAFARHGQADRAGPLLGRAAGLYQRLGAARDLARADAALRAAGVRRGRRRATRDRPRFGWASMTPTEHAVARLVAEGLSNPQIGARMYISSRTVQTHLAHIFARLDISSRVQLAAEVTRRQHHGALSASWRISSTGREAGDEDVLAAGAVGGWPDVEDLVTRGRQARGDLVAAAEAEGGFGGDDGAVGAEGVGVAEGDEREVDRGDFAAVLDRAGTRDVEGDRGGAGGPLLPGPVPRAAGLEHQVAARAQSGSYRPQGLVPVLVGEEDLGDVPGHQREIGAGGRGRGGVAVDPGDAGAAVLGPGYGEGGRGRVDRQHGVAGPGQRDGQGSGAAADVEHAAGVQFPGDGEVSGQVVARTVEGVVDRGQAGMGEDRVGHVRAPRSAALRSRGVRFAWSG